MAKTVKVGRTTFWEDGEGTKIPQNRIKPEEKKRDELVEKSLAKVAKLQAQLKKAKKALSATVHTYLDETAAEYGEEWQGNAVLYNFSQDKAIHVNVQRTISFDEKLPIAKAKIDNCIARWSKGSNNNIKALVTGAFGHTDDDKINPRSILKLRKYKIDDQTGEWKEAMDLISDAVIIKSTKEHIRFKLKDDSGKWETLSLQFSAL